MNVDFTSNKDKAEDEMEEAIARALVTCGLVAEEYAKKLCTVDTGFLRNSITFALDGEPAQISTYKADKGDKEGTYSGTAEKTAARSVSLGTNVEYAAYVELGTGKNTEGGRQDPWSYKDDKGQMHKTSGHEAKPFLKPAIADHAQKYRDIINKELAGK